MKWEVILTHEVEGSVTISEPEGLSSSVIAFTRHPEFHTLVKEFKTSISLYGSNGTQDGRRDWVKNIESIHGPDAVIGILFRYAPDNYTFQDLYQGEIGVQTIIESLDFSHDLEFTPVQIGFWRKFISRYDVPVDVQSAVNLDGNTVEVLVPETVTLLPQAIRELNQTKQDQAALLVGSDWPDTFTSPDFQKELDTNEIAQIGLDNNYVDEISDFHNIPSGVIVSGDQANALITFEYGGVYSFDIKFAITAFFTNTFNAFATAYYNLAGVTGVPPFPETPSSSAFKGEMYIQFNDEIPILLTATHKQYTFAVNDPDAVDPTWNQSNGWTEFTFADTRTLEVSDQVRIWFKNTGDEFGYGNNSSTIVVYQPYILGENNNFLMQPALEALYPGESLYTDIVFTGDNHAFWKAFGNPEGAVSYINITGDTLSKTTTAPGFLTHDLAASILDRITEPDKFYSPLFGSPYTKSRAYEENGAWWNNINMGGIQARGYTLSEKLLSRSFKDWWEGANPMFNLSLGYEKIEGFDRIVVRTKAEAYDSSSMSVLLSGVQRIKRKYGPDYFNTVQTGYAKGKTEDISGINDPQSEDRASILKNIGRSLKILTDWIGQGLTIEQAKRTTKKKSADYKYDNDTLVIEVTRTGSGQYSPRLNEDFTSITGVLNEDSRYNKHHTPARFFLRWLDFLSGGLQKYLGTVFRFTGGDGNYDMTSTMVDGSALDDYGGQDLAEKGNIPVGTTYLWVPKIFEIEHYLTIEELNTIDANRNKAIGISQSYEDGSHKPFFIDDLQLEIMSGQIKLTGKFQDEFDIISVPPGSQIFQGGKIFDSTFDYTFE